MQIFSICCVRDEVDVIAETLGAASEWSDQIFVLDNGSVDGTWELLKQLEGGNSKLVLLGQELEPFSEELRGTVFEARRQIANPGDWWCRLDADEIYIDDPRDFLDRTPSLVGFVWSATFNFYLTEIDVEAYEADPYGWLERPVQERLHHYQNNWSEGRFVRHRSDLRWKGLIWPENRGITDRRRIRLKHYQYRSPNQIQRRLEIRQPRPDIFPHESRRSLPVPDRESKNWVRDWMRKEPAETATWRDRVRTAADCDVDLGDGSFLMHEELMPALPRRGPDFARAMVQSSRAGAAMTRPLRRWRGHRRQVGDPRA